MSNSLIRHEDNSFSFSTDGLKLSSGTTDPGSLAAGEDGDIYFFEGTSSNPKGIYIYKTSTSSWRNIPNIDDITVNVGELIAKPVCMAASTANLTVVYNNGSSGVGATLTNAGTQAAFAIDGYTASLNDRILIKDQTNQTQNGIYTVTTLGSGSTNWVLTRSTDFDTSANAINGGYVFVDNGTVNVGSGWVFVYPSGTVIFGTTNIVWNKFIQFSIVAGSGISISGSTINVNYDNVTLGLVSNTLVVRSTSTANQVLLSSGTAGASAAWSTFTDAAHGSLSGGSLHALATDSLNGFMSATDKTKLDGFSVVSGQLQLINGSNSVPSYSFSNSTNTGMFLNATGDLMLSAGGVSLLELKDIASPGSITSFAPIYQNTGSFTTTGDAKAGQYTLRNSTSNATSTQLYIDGSTKQITLTSTNSTVFTFEAFINAVQTVSPFATKSWRLAGTIQQSGTAASTALVGTVSKDILSDSSSGSLTWDVSASADTTNGALKINITGAASTSIKWLARVATTELMV